MSDFRVPIAPSDSRQDFFEELDWNNQTRSWTVSEKAFSGGSWLENISPSIYHLETLLEFFRIGKDMVPLENLAHVSPGELTLLHQNTSGLTSVYAMLCSRCSQHWHVFRWEEKENEWKVYGRDCEFSWKRGDSLSAEDIVELSKLRNIPDKPLQPPRK